MKKFKTTEEIEVPTKLVDQVIGQKKAVDIIKKAAKQKRNVLLIGTPGTGKSMLAQAMAELMPVEELEDVLVYKNHNNDNNPKIRTVKTYPDYNYLKMNPQYLRYYTKPELLAIKQLSQRGEKKQLPDILKIGLGRRIVNKVEKHEKEESGPSPKLIILLVGLILLGIIFFADIEEGLKWLIIAVLLGLTFLYFLSGATAGLTRRLAPFESSKPKLIVDNSTKKNAPFVDATGAKAGALLGDVKHDPLQCILMGEYVSLPNGRMEKIENIVDPIFKEHNSWEKKLNENEKFSILGAYDDKFGYGPTKVNAIFKRKYSDYIFEIKTRRGYTIKVTPNHPLGIFNRENIEYLRADVLTEGQYTTVPRALPIEFKKELKLDLIRLYANILADGSVSERSVIFKVKREFKIERLIRNIRKCGFEPRILSRGGNTLIYINNANFVRELKTLGLIENGKKRIPSIIFDQRKEGILDFLSEFYSLDGYVNKNGQFELFSKELIPDFVPLLLKIGIRAVIKERKDPGFGKGKIQTAIYFSNFEFSKEYSNRTINPIHMRNLEIYFKNTNKGHVIFSDVIPIKFNFLENIRMKIGLSMEKIHSEYYALNEELKSSKKATRQMLNKVSLRFLEYSNGLNIFKLRDIVQGKYDFDQIISIRKIKVSGFVYNLTTETGNYLVNNILTHNTGGMGTPAHLRVEGGAIHKANNGVLFIDEIASLKMNWQQEILTAMQ
ncbi:MAG: ATP-binding protein, partial [Candidatus ainarchaeum sp.]|nr:ATP-binding protein [Candidatus ainarchaeum sp.]